MVDNSKTTTANPTPKPETGLLCPFLPITHHNSIMMDNKPVDTTVTTYFGHCVNERCMAWRGHRACARMV